MDVATIAIVVAVLGLGLNVVVAVRSAQWGLPDRLAKMEGRIMGAVEGHKNALDVEIDRIKGSMADASGVMRREFGETVRAMQQKISDIEKYVRDTFVPKDGFYQATTDIKQALAERSKQNDERLSRLEGKIDSLTTHLLENKDT